MVSQTVPAIAAAAGIAVARANSAERNVVRYASAAERLPRLDVDTDSPTKPNAVTPRMTMATIASTIENPRWPVMMKESGQGLSD